MKSRILQSVSDICDRITMTDDVTIMKTTLGNLVKVIREEEKRLEDERTKISFLRILTQEMLDDPKVVHSQDILDRIAHIAIFTHDNPLSVYAGQLKHNQNK